MTHINKHRFLAELGKLLTFMYEEDRDAVLELYAKMFDDANDETALLQHLVSPTRQAVLVARSYNSREKKLQVSSTSREQFQLDAEENPEYLTVVEDIRKEAEAKGLFGARPAWTVSEEGEAGAEPEPEVSKDQISLFEETEPEAADEIVNIDAPEDAAMPDYSEARSEEPATAEESAPVNPDEEKKVDEFMSSFHISEEELTEQAETAEEQPAAAEAEPAEPVPEAAAQMPETPAFVPEDIFEEEPLPEEPVRTIRKARPLLLILFIIIAVPLCIAGLAILLVPTLLCLSLSVVAIVAGVMMLTAAIGSFAVIADMLLIGGLAVVALALGLLFLWLFVWFIGGAMVSLIRGIIDLGGKWCYKEVQA